VTVAAGCLAGAALSYGLAAVTARWLPTLELTATGVDVALVSLVLISVSPVGATVPMIRLRRIDPVEAFRP
ncbi:MAG: hypothetical protein GWN71_25650, partial [Gammaproteobacteria bacterium]|nr:hypothetical protein [Gammaproteobacteria bacterium]NIY10532.1 hypothetical protein [Gemmatimonadota bacterium]